jgi:hypothetical protein
MKRTIYRNMQMKIYFLTLFLFCLPNTLNAACDAGSLLTAPTSRFTDNGDGTVTDRVTLLMWKRCDEGKSWDGVGCSGSPTVTQWDKIFSMNGGGGFAGYNDWRVPNIKELASILEFACNLPPINSEVFPLSFSSYWSSTPSARDRRLVFILSMEGLGAPAILTADMTISAAVRMVRNSQ